MSATQPRRITDESMRSMELIHCGTRNRTMNLGHLICCKHNRPVVANDAMMCCSLGSFGISTRSLGATVPFNFQALVKHLKADEIVACSALLLHERSKGGK